MNVKIDTKEKFTVITPLCTDFSANMTDELLELLFSYQNKQIPHIILNLKEAETIKIEFAEKISAMQKEFYEKSLSFVICEMHQGVAAVFEHAHLLEWMNTTPTESEAWDIIQMEEIERELMRDFDESAS